jgi:hypothetical protein
MSQTRVDRNSSLMSHVNRSARRARSPQPPAAKKIPPTHEQIATRAHGLWRQRGCPPDRALEIWLEAEAQLEGEAWNG